MSDQTISGENSFIDRRVFSDERLVGFFPPKTQPGADLLQAPAIIDNIFAGKNSINLTADERTRLRELER